jgi:glycine hydroxymethyltransferase
LFALSDQEWGLNVQMLSGSFANFAVVTALCEPNARILSLHPHSGGNVYQGYQDKKVSSRIMYRNEYNIFL